jgi:hypothetical protein
MSLFKFKYYYPFNRLLYLSILLPGPLIMGILYNNETPKYYENSTSYLRGYLELEINFLLAVFCLESIVKITEHLTKLAYKQWLRFVFFLLLVAISITIFGAVSLLVERLEFNIFINLTLAAIVLLVPLRTKFARANYDRLYALTFCLSTLAISLGGIAIFNTELSLIPLTFASAVGFWGGTSVFTARFFAKLSQVHNRQMRNFAAFLILTPGITFSTLSLMQILPWFFRFNHLLTIFNVFVLHKNRNSSDKGYANLILALALVSQTLFFIFLLIFLKN